MGTGQTPAHHTLVDSGSHILTETGTLHALLPSCSSYVCSVGVSPRTSDVAHGMYSTHLLAGSSGDVDEAEGSPTQLVDMGMRRRRCTRAEGEEIWKRAKGQKQKMQERTKKE